MMFLSLRGAPATVRDDVAISEIASLSLAMTKRKWIPAFAGMTMEGAGMTRPAKAPPEWHTRVGLAFGQAGGCLGM